MKKKFPKLISFKSFSDKTGKLTPFYVSQHLPKGYKLRRFFFLFGKKNYLRADHAHKKCTQFIVPIVGKVKITTFNNKKKKIFILDHKKELGLIVPTYTWLNIKFYKNNDCLLTTCDYKYDKKEYISNFKVFKQNYF